MRFSWASRLIYCSDTKYKCFIWHGPAAGVAFVSATLVFVCQKPLKRSKHLLWMSNQYSVFFAVKHQSICELLFTCGLFDRTYLYLVWGRCHVSSPKHITCGEQEGSTSRFKRWSGRAGRRSLMQSIRIHPPLTIWVAWFLRQIVVIFVVNDDASF